VTAPGSGATAGAYVSATHSGPCPTGTSLGTLGAQMNPAGDIQVEKLRAGSLGIVYSAVLGANCLSTPGALAVASDGTVTFSAGTGAGFPLHNADDDTVSRAAVAQLSPDGSSLVFSTYVDAPAAPPIAVSGRRTVYAGVGASILALRVRH